MAKKTLVQLTDDLDGNVIADGAGETLTFAVRGTSYEIDLSSKNVTAFEKAVAKYVDAARKTSPTPRRAASKGAITAKSDFDPKAVRVWAEANGVEVSPRGRIKGEVVDMWRSASA
jgi:hypothetical protein